MSIYKYTDLELYSDAGKLLLQARVDHDEDNDEPYVFKLANGDQEVYLTEKCLGEAMVFLRKARTARKEG